MEYYHLENPTTGRKKMEGKEVIIHSSAMTHSTHRQLEIRLVPRNFRVAHALP